MNNTLFFPLFMAYILGSVPTAVWVGKTFFNKDIRTEGSGNAGATNAFRVFGAWAGSLVLFVDCFKGYLAVYLANQYSDVLSDEGDMMLFRIALGIAALIGHLFPVFAGFKGGKGVATLLGVVISLHPAGAFSSLGVFLLVLVLTRYVSLGSMLACLSFPIWTAWAYSPPSLQLAVFGIVMAGLVIITHRKNVQRLLKGEESRVNLFGKK